MIKSMNQENQKGASSEVGRVLMLVSLFVCYVASALAGNNASGSLMESNTNIVFSPAFSTVSTGQLGSSESNNSGDKLFIVSGSRHLKSGNYLAETSAFGTISSDSAPVGNDGVFGNVNGADQDGFFIYSIAEVNNVSRLASLYAPLFNYASEEKYQA
ncbi:MAG: hypothetical protein ACKOX3_04415 [Bacteroidota bacterium]